jgi:hypothetical protein
VEINNPQSRVEINNPQSRVEIDKDKHLHDMVQKYSSGEISREQYTRTLGLKYQA